VAGTFYYLTSLLDGYSRFIVHWELRESMTVSRFTVNWKVVLLALAS
jgi:transposase InsO family protein